MKRSLKNDNPTKQKERHIVSWSQEEDDVLREQIRVHGTENWAVIASNFKDKSTRQCRRRWFTYLNSDFKKGGWSPEEDMLLCEAQKVFGNRWTEIAKVVSGRTDNAVKNRFNTLCKKKAKHDALSKENGSTSFVNLNNKRVIFPNGLNADSGSENVVPVKKTRTCISQHTSESCNDEKLDPECGSPSRLLRLPFALITQNLERIECGLKEGSTCESVSNNIRGTLLKKDDPKVIALMQQAELLSSLAIKVNPEKTDRSPESSWMVLRDFLKRNKESEAITFEDLDVDFQVQKFKELLETLTWRQIDLYDSSPACSEYSTGSTLLSNAQCDKSEEFHADTSKISKKASPELPSDHCFVAESEICLDKCSDQSEAMFACEEMKENGVAGEYSSTEFTSPIQQTPMFRALAATIPSPKFSESEKNFLMKALGMESTLPNSRSNPSQAPLCKRSLLHCL